MKNDTLIIIAAAAAGLFLIYKTAGRTTVATRPGGTVLNQSNRTGAMPSGSVYNTTGITNTALPGQEGYGWQYFSDGTAIGPDGRYYFQGAEVYNPAGVLA